MAQKTITLLFLIGLLAISKAVFLENKMGSHFAIFSQLKSIEDSEFGKKILDTIALQLQNKSPLSEVASLLKELRSNLVSQENEAKAKWNNQQLECEREISDFNARIKNADSEIQEATRKIYDLERAIDGLQNDIKNYVRQLEILAQRESDARVARAADEKRFEARAEEHKQVLLALDLIIPKLESLIGSVPGEAPAILAELAKIGSTNPIASLMQLASSLDQNALNNVLQKLKELRDSIDNSSKDDQNDEDQSIREYNNLLAEVSQVRISITALKTKAEGELSDAQIELGSQRKRLSSNQLELNNATEGLRNKNSQCDNWKKTYETESAKR